MSCCVRCGVCSRRRRSSRRPGCSPRTGASAASPWTTRRCAASSRTSSGCSDAAEEQVAARGWAPRGEEAAGAAARRGRLLRHAGGGGSVVDAGGDVPLPAHGQSRGDEVLRLPRLQPEHPAGGGAHRGVAAGHRAGCGGSAALAPALLGPPLTAVGPAG